MTNEFIKNELSGYMELYNGKYWNAGLNDSTLYADNWGVTESSSGTGNEYGNAWQCYGFSLFMAKVLFGKIINYGNICNAPDNGNLEDGWMLYQNNYSSISLEPGDIIRKGDDSTGHSAVVWKVENGLLYFVECLGNMNNQLHWGGFNNSDVGTSEEYIKSIAVYIIKAPKTSGTTVTVTFNPGVGTCSTTGKQVETGGLYGIFPVPTRAGHTFMGWWNTSANTECISSTTVTATVNHTLTAIWGKTYKLTNVGAGKCLNINGSNLTALSDSTNVTLWSNSGSNEQKWILSLIYDDKPVKSVIDRNYGLNVYCSGSPYNCNIHLVAGNETDAIVYLTNYGSYYKISLHNHNLNLTAQGAANGSNVCWSAPAESDLQKWTLTEL